MMTKDQATLYLINNPKTIAKTLVECDADYRAYEEEMLSKIDELDQQIRKLRQELAEEKRKRTRAAFPKAQLLIEEAYRTLQGDE